MLDLSPLEIPHNHAVLKVFFSLFFFFIFFFFFFYTMEGGSVGRGEPGSRGDRI